jgi:hypothetical protein
MRKELNKLLKVNNTVPESTMSFFSKKENKGSFFKPTYVQMQKDTLVSGGTTATKQDTWKDKLTNFDPNKSSPTETIAFYKDLLEQEISKTFGKKEMVDVLFKGDTKCNPDHLTLMLEMGDGKLGDYAPPDIEKENKDVESRKKVDLGVSKDVNSLNNPETQCRRVFLNDIEKDNPQRFHATYFHESKHDDHRKLYIKYFKEWKSTYKKSKKPKAFTTWIREKLTAKKSAIDLALIEEDHTRLTGTLFNESVAHLKTLEWMDSQKGISDIAIKLRFASFVEYASNIADNANIVIDAFVKIYKKMSKDHQKAIKEVIQLKKEPKELENKRYSIFYGKLSEKI